MKKLLLGLGAVALFSVLGLFMLSRQDREPNLEDLEGLEISNEVGTRAVTLFFPESDAEGLGSQSRTIEARPQIDEELEAVVALLLVGPQGGSLLSAFPDSTRLLGCFWNDDRRWAYLDFSSEMVGPSVAGTATELMILSSLLRTIAVAFPEVEAVQILVEGTEVQTLGGHLDLTRPLRPSDWL